MIKRTRAGLALTFAAAGALGAQSAMAAPKKVPVPQPKPAIHAIKQPPARVVQHVPLPRKRPLPGAVTPRTVAQRAPLTISTASFSPLPLTSTLTGRFEPAPTAAASPEDIALVKQVIEAARKGRETDADAAERSIGNPAARKLAEWVILRSDNTRPSFERYAAFVTANPSWPHAALFRRRAENALWNDGVPDATVLAFFSVHKPRTAKGRYMLARTLLAKGDREGAAALVRYAWRYEECSADAESKVLEMFGSLLTRADHKVRMDQRFYTEDIEAGMRAATRLGGDELAIGRARAAVIKRLNTTKALLDAVPPSARHDPGYIFSRVQWLRKDNKPEEAGKLILTVSQDPAALVDVDQWWQERRILVRKLLDDGDPHTAYLVARDAASPKRGYFRADHHFTAGWIALRFLHDPKIAAAHFARIVENTVSPYALSRGGYWQGRAAEAMGQRAQAKAFYEMAAQYTATYYGQIARARLGLADLGLRGPPSFTPAKHEDMRGLEVVRAAEVLYALNERDFLASMYAELGESGTDVLALSALAELAGKHGDGRAMLLLGEAAYGRGLPLEYYAYPTVGLPAYSPIAPAIDSAVTYSIARQESHFSQKVVSVAHAMGLMQVTPEAAIDTAKKFKAVYNRARLLNDPVYNMQMGTAELSNLLTGYNGSYILTFAGYNAGRGRVRQWIAAYGDPRDPKVDPIDWAERIPIAETRNYVQRIMENLQVYRARFGGGGKLMIEADLRRGATN
ncbi:MAG TPA: lytic transglycosylase domain-containing protein [Pseudolabrys sp.]